jgi:hypothetical protein
VRGDSRLDLYTKSLALIGLATLGVAGALIDYRPGAVPPPTMASVNTQRLLPADQARPDVRYRGLSHSRSAASLPGVASRAAAQRPSRKSARPVPDGLADGAGMVSASSPATTRDAAGLPIEGARFQTALPAISLDARLDSATDGALLDEPDTTADRHRLAPQPPAADRSEEGLLSGVLKRTSTSVSSSLGKASNSLVGAVRVVGVVVRKAF